MRQKMTEETKAKRKAAKERKAATERKAYDAFEPTEEAYDQVIQTLQERVLDGLDFSEDVTPHYSPDGDVVLEVSKRIWIDAKKVDGRWRFYLNDEELEQEEEASPPK